MNISSSDLRKKFLEYFEKRGHKILPSASLVPEDDPSVLFTTAGMQQFKRYYLFPDESPSARIATCQKCLRTGDIDEVGDESHLTFFEMLGNFSFGYPKKDGSYFKEEAIKMAWEFLTSKLEISADRISATYFSGENDLLADEESLKILEQIKELKKIESTGFSETFWSLGTENSPGGPTVEFYIDEVEVWNLVFNEYVLHNGKYVQSEFQGVDTGMGLERLLAVLNGEKDVFKTDLFAPIISKIENISGKKYSRNKKEFRIIADHLKAAMMLIADGVLPSNKDQGYILRRLIRRAIVKGKQIGVEENFCEKLFDSICHPGLDPESIKILKQVQDDIKNELEKEETKFRKTLSLGLMEFKKWFAWESQLDKKIVPGSVAFNLFATYGFPIELTREIAKEKGLIIDEEGYQKELKNHQNLSRTASAGMFKGGLADNKVETTKLHTAAHLLLAALRQVLSKDVQQKGSNITEERLRFDFNWPEKLTPEQIAEVEKIVNEKIKEDIPVVMEEMSVEEAKNFGATGVFDDRYGEKVKVYSIGDFSKEICGGPHVKSTGKLGTFKITKEESSSAGVRRIKAILE
ncbi:MAG: alanyl-tRNA synthetase [Candidatus Berkelbacteria bacterium Athens1014_28]|uniref:alanine--tRNA ligase n=1 Tax=Candidatus Berkelbacteria bacterium Athens1014_28 TaxID=2017145 RepID=A0A554LP17_9BACT|nr:MAG: alanyl-tRNA synthetase [Candidatus Berkelbacteria bacterium Athens1014_28]